MDYKMVIEKLEKLDNKLDKTNERLNDIDKTLVKQEASLSEHIRRTEINEEAIGLVRDEMKPVKKHIYMMEGALKLLGVLSLLVGLLVGVLKLFGI